MVVFLSELSQFTGQKLLPLRTVQATGIAAFTRTKIVCNIADLHAKYTQTNMRVIFYMDNYMYSFHYIKS